MFVSHVCQKWESVVAMNFLHLFDPHDTGSSENLWEVVYALGCLTGCASLYKYLRYLGHLPLTTNVEKIANTLFKMEFRSRYVLLSAFSNLLQCRNMSLWYGSFSGEHTCCLAYAICFTLVLQGFWNARQTWDMSGVSSTLRSTSRAREAAIIKGDMWLVRFFKTLYKMAPVRSVFSSSLSPKFNAASIWLCRPDLGGK